MKQSPERPQYSTPSDPGFFPPVTSLSTACGVSFGSKTKGRREPSLQLARFPQTWFHFPVLRSFLQNIMNGWGAIGSETVARATETRENSPTSTSRSRLSGGAVLKRATCARVHASMGLGQADEGTWPCRPDLAQTRKSIGHEPEEPYFGGLQPEFKFDIADPVQKLAC